ncbi:hypothetical protein PIB30_043906 [Stylosanthes scabra]|uniref:Uncharacterized protein n=1 Tax=Stylosanthes scabra TaxID=79078 RepID=A0ABU6UIY3_9FABA|nr:hypothetical protein [Stylosanthes scabra]
MGIRRGCTGIRWNQFEQISGIHVSSDGIENNIGLRMGIEIVADGNKGSLYQSEDDVEVFSEEDVGSAVDAKDLC